jgi:hypothetical protein
MRVPLYLLAQKAGFVQQRPLRIRLMLKPLRENCIKPFSVVLVRKEPVISPTTCREMPTSLSWRTAAVKCVGSSKKVLLLHVQGKLSLLLCLCWRLYWLCGNSLPCEWQSQPIHNKMSTCIHWCIGLQSAQINSWLTRYFLALCFVLCLYNTLYTNLKISGMLCENAAHVFPKHMFCLSH